MPDWNQILNEIQNNVDDADNKRRSTFDIVRRKYLKKLHQLTERNVIIYYSGWLQKPHLSGVVGVNDADKNGFMAVIHGLDRSKGLDLILHTPGGNAAATESLVNYLREMFGTNMRAFVPQLALSGGTMIACACKQIYMGKHSSLGPVDPQLNGIPANGVIEEFKRAYTDILTDSNKIPIWQPILAKYQPTLIVECERVIKWANEMVTEWLQTGMFENPENDVNKDNKIQKIIDNLTDHAISKSHDRHLSYKQCEEIGLEVLLLEDEQNLQEAVLSVHHACIHTLSETAAFKIIENHDGKAFIQTVAEK